MWDLPVIFIIENNGYGLSTPTSEQYRCKNLVDKAAGYGIEGIQIDGNNILSVYDTIKGVREYCVKNQKPYLIECMTFRMRGHEEASGVKYVPPEMFEQWAKKDPVKNYEQYLIAENVLTAKKSFAMYMRRQKWVRLPQFCSLIMLILQTTHNSQLTSHDLLMALKKPCIKA